MNRNQSNSERRRKTRLNGLESLECRRVLSGDGFELGPFLEDFSAGIERAEQIASELKLEMDSASEIRFDGYLNFEDQFDSASDVDLFTITTPALSADATGNGLLNLSTWSLATAAPSIVVIADELGEPIYADLAIAPFVGTLSLEVEPETTYVCAIGQLEGVEGFPVDNNAGLYQVDISYWEPTPIPPEPDDLEGDTREDAMPIESELAFGYLNSGDDIDYFRFTATQTGVLNFILDAAPAALAEIRIEDASGTTLASETTFLVPVEAMVDIEEGETYYLSIRSTDGNGYYSLHTIEGVLSPPQVEPPADAHGDAIDSATDITDLGPFAVGYGAINTADDVDWFKISNGDFGVQFIGDDSITAEITTADGVVIDTLVGGGDILKTFTEPSETYLRVSSSDFSAPTFYDFFVLDAATLGLDVATPSVVEPIVDEVAPKNTADDLIGDSPATATPLTDFSSLGITGLWFAEGQLNGFSDEGILDVDVYSASFERDSTIFIQVTSPGSPADPEFQIALVDSDGALWGEGTTELRFDIPSTGEYFLQISSADEVGGAFRVEVTQEIGPTATPEPIVLTSEELAVLLGVDLGEMTSGTETEPDVTPDTDSSNSTPDVLSIEELLSMLGLLPEDVASIDSEVPTVSEGVEPPSTNGDDVAVDRLAADVLMGDIDGNDSVDFGDFLTMSRYFGTEQGAEWKHGSFDGDGDVDFDDFILLSSQFGKSRS